MEVPHHAHTERKKWTHYLWEFLMLFFAVTLGFFVENQREHYVEHQREKQFMGSLKEDLQTDLINLDQQIEEQYFRNQLYDSLIYLLNHPSVKEHTGQIYYIARKTTRTDGFPVTDRTINQMRNAGTFRLVRSQEVAKAILDYYKGVEIIKFLEGIDDHETQEFRKQVVELFDIRVFQQMIDDHDNVTRPQGNPELQTYDQKELMKLSGWVHFIKTSRYSIMLGKKDLKGKAEKLITLLNKEYNLK